MEELYMSIIKDILKRYNIVYDRYTQIIDVKQPICVEDFIYLKQMLKGTNLKIKDIRVGGAKLLWNGL